MHRTNRFYFTTGFLLFLFFGGLKLAAQDTLILIDRKPKIVVLREINDSMVVYSRFRKQKLKYIERDKVYSIHSPDKEPQIIYIQDTLEGNWYTTEEMKDYIRGQQDAQLHYNRRARLAGFTGFVAGVGFAATGVLYGPFLAAGYVSVAGLIKPAFTQRLGFDPTMNDNRYYVEGFGTYAKRKAFQKTALGTGIGLALGLVLFTIILQ